MLLTMYSLNPISLSVTCLTLPFNLQIWVLHPDSPGPSSCFLWTTEDFVCALFLLTPWFCWIRLLHSGMFCTYVGTHVHIYIYRCVYVHMCVCTVLMLCFHFKESCLKAKIPFHTLCNTHTINYIWLIETFFLSKDIGLVFSMNWGG